nr:hypothetical protein [uncultured Blautia sp.]
MTVEKLLRNHAKRVNKLARKIRLMKSLKKNRKRLWKISKAIATVMEKRL